MSSIMPRFLMRRIDGLIERRLPLKGWDAFNQFRVQTRLIFSRAILLLVAALFGVFSWAALMNYEELGNREYGERSIYTMLSFQVVILAILLNMNLWEAEREGRTFELLIMRIPNLHHLIWHKMRVSLFWMTAIALPFFAAYGWFLAIPFWRLLVFFVFILSFAVLVAFFTCIVASFVHQGLTAGIVTFILTFIGMAFCEDLGWDKLDYVRLYVNPFRLRHEGLTTTHTVWILLANRAVVLLALWGFYAWLRRRLSKTEKWIQ